MYVELRVSCDITTIISIHIPNIHLGGVRDDKQLLIQQQTDYFKLDEPSHVCNVCPIHPFYSVFLVLVDRFNNILVCIKVADFCGLNILPLSIYILFATLAQTSPSYVKRHIGKLECELRNTHPCESYVTIEKWVWHKRQSNRPKIKF